MKADGLWLVAGALIFCAGIGMVSLPAAVALAGVLMCALAILLRDR